MCVSAASQQTCIRVDMSWVAWVSWARSQSRVSSTTFMKIPKHGRKGGQNKSRIEVPGRQSVVASIFCDTTQNGRGAQQPQQCSRTAVAAPKTATGTRKQVLFSYQRMKHKRRESHGFHGTAPHALGRFGCARCAASSPLPLRPPSVSSRSPCGCPHLPPIQGEFNCTRWMRSKDGRMAQEGRLRSAMQTW